MKVYFQSKDKRFTLYHGDCIDILYNIDLKADLIFADPPYFLSNNGTTCKAGKRSSVNKGRWDQKNNINDIHDFNKKWLNACINVMHDNSTIWISGTHHNIYSVGMGALELKLKILNNIVWRKPNPPPNLSCKYFTHSTETILWICKDKSKYTFNYKDMRAENGGKQMKDVWDFSPPSKKEKTSGSHPTQKPLNLLERIIKAGSNENNLILDPFNGSATSGIAAYKLNRKYIGIEQNIKYLELSKKRFMENT